MQPSLQGPLPTTADGWKPHKNSSELSPFAYHYNPNRKYASALPRQKKKRKKEKSVSESVFIQMAFAFRTQCCDICPFDVSKWWSAKRCFKSSLFQISFILNRKAPGFYPVPRAKETASLKCTTEFQQDQGDWNVKQPAPNFTSPPYSFNSPILKYSLPSHTSPKKKAQQQQLSRLELQCSTILTCYSISIRRMHYVSQTTSACRLNLASPLYSLPNTWIIKMLISATQNGTLLLYCEFDAQCLWCKHFLASVISMSEGQFRRTVFVREGKPTNVKDSST